MNECVGIEKVKAQRGVGNGRVGSIALLRVWPKRGIRVRAKPETPGSKRVVPHAPGGMTASCVSSGCGRRTLGPFVFPTSLKRPYDLLENPPGPCYDR